jgi:serine/threonine-protein kinase HipA
MTLASSAYGVWLGDVRAGTLHQRGDHTRFVFSDAYLDDPARPVLGLVFEEDAQATFARALRLPPWFSNLLPEGVLRRWIADDRGVSPDREMELLAQVGHDLPGAVRVIPDPDEHDDQKWPVSVRGAPIGDGGSQWRFSLAGVGLKFSMLAREDRLTLPAYGQGGDWIVKLPDAHYANVPRNEYAMMTFAKACGIDVPDVQLVHRDQISGLSAALWPDGEEWAYAVRRFDRMDGRAPVHIEDLAQVRDFYPEQKYLGSYETVAALLFRSRHLGDLREFARRLAFCVLIGNGDAHLKNWSLIYRDPQSASLSPAYDLVCTGVYHARFASGPQELGLRWRRSHRMNTVTAASFQHLERRLNATGAELADVVHDLVTEVITRWSDHATGLAECLELVATVTDSIDTHRATLLSRY